MNQPARQVVTRLALVVLLLGLTAVFWWRRPSPDISAERASSIAHILFDRYAAETGEPGSHFQGPRTISYSDGWEYNWAYVPCAEITALRIFISRRGEASYTQIPDCYPIRGFPVLPQSV